MFKKNFALFVMTLALCLFAQTAHAQTYFTGNLDGAQETPPNAATAKGFGRVTLNAAETQITVSVYYGTAAAPLSANVTVGHIHTGAIGVAGPVTFDLVPATGVAFGSVVNRTFTINATQLASLKAGNMYFNIHTTAFPGGEIRG